MTESTITPWRVMFLSWVKKLFSATATRRPANDQWLGIGYTSVQARVTAR